MSFLVSVRKFYVLVRMRLLTPDSGACFQQHIIPWQKTQVRLEQAVQV